MIVTLTNTQEKELRKERKTKQTRQVKLDLALTFALDEQNHIVLSVEKEDIDKALANILVNFPSLPMCERDASGKVIFK